MVFRTIKRPVRGFSLIELTVVMTIFSLITLIVLANHNKFNSSVLLGDLGYNVALTVRQAQVYGLSVQQYNANFQIGYGIHLASTGSYIMFADTNANGRYDNGTDPVVTTYNVSSPRSIGGYCAYTSTNVADCSDGRNTGTAITYLDIVFFRPNPDALFATSHAATTYSRADIRVTSTTGETRTVTIASTGQISVTNP